MSWINSNATSKQNSKNDLSFYHGFSKTPVEPNTSNGSAVTTLANASTKSGHTVSATEVWASEIPWFGLVPSKAVAVTRLSGITKKNDLVRVNGDKDYIYIGKGDEVFTEATWSTYWSPITLTNGMELENQYGDKVLRYYEKQQMQALEPNNNAGIDSKGFATRLFVDESKNTAVTTVGQGSVISQFVAGTDNIKNGIASSELNPVLYLGDTQKIAGTHYYDYNVSGTILWNANVKSSNPKITCFRYIGKTVTQQVSEISSTVKTHSSEISEIKDKLGLGGTDTPGTPTLGTRVTDNETALRTLLGIEGEGKVVATESIATTAANAASTAISNATAALGTDGIFVDGQEAKLATVEGVIGYVEDYVAKNAAVTVKSGAYSKQITSLELAGSTGADVNVSVTGADATTGSKYTFAATVNKATVSNGVADSADKLVTAGGAKSIAEKAATDAISSAINDGSTIDNRIDAVINTAIADGGVIDTRIDTLISDATSTSAIVDNDTSNKLVTAKQVSDYVASEVGAIDTGVASVKLGSTIPAGISLGTDTKNPVLTIETSIADAAHTSSKLITASAAHTLATHYASVAEGAAVNTINGKSLTSLASSTQGSYVTVTTGGTVGSGLTVNVNDSALASTVSAASTAIQGITLNGAAAGVSKDGSNVIDITLPKILIGNNSSDNHGFSVTSSSNGDGSGVSNHYLHIADASYDTKTKTWANGTTNYFPTASTVESFVNATVGADLTALENKVNAYHKAGVSYKIHTESTLPDLSIEDNVKEYKNVILLVSKEIIGPANPPSALSGDYTEFLCVNKGTEEAPQWVWEQIGTTAADLKGYVKAIRVNDKQKYTDPGDVYLTLGSFAETVASGQATTLANQGSVYANIATNGTLTVGVASATDSVMGVSKMFTGNLSTAASTVTDTAVSVKSAQAMYSSLATLANSKISNVVASTYLSLAGFSVTTQLDTERAITPDVLNSTNGSLQPAVANARPVKVEGGILTSTGGDSRVIATDKIVNGSNMFASTTIVAWVDDLSSMKNGTAMFKNSSLTVFVGDLSSLETADEMFYGCTLDAESLEILSENLPTVLHGGTIDIGASTNATAEVIATIKGKRWTLKSNGTAL